VRNTPTRLPGTPLAPATVALRRRSRSATFRPVDDRNGDGENGAVVVAAVRCSASGSLRWSSSRSAPPSIPPSIPSSIPPYSHRRTPRPPSPAARTTAGSRGGSGRSRAAGPADGERHLTQPPPGSRLPAARSVDQQQGQTRFGIEMWGTWFDRQSRRLAATWAHHWANRSSISPIAEARRSRRMSP